MFRQKAVLATLLLGSLLITACDTNTAPTSSPTTTTKEKPFTKFHKIVDVEFVKSKLSLSTQSDVMLIDARPYKGKFIKGYIPGAVSIPFSQFKKKTDMLPKDKSTLLIFYCQGTKCSLSHKSAYAAEKLGYTNVVVYNNGYPEWIKKGNYGALSIEYVTEQVAANKAVVIDARPFKTKFIKGHIPGAISLPFPEFEKLKGKLPRKLTTPIITYCGGLKCRLSHKLATAAMQMGYTDVKVFEHGYPAWKKAHGAGSVAPTLSSTEDGTISYKKFRHVIANQLNSVTIIDVRDKDEFATGSFKGALNISVDELEEKAATLAADKPIIFVCSTGARSGEAYWMLRDIRPELKNIAFLDAEITFKKDGSFDLKKPE